MSIGRYFGVAGVFLSLAYGPSIAAQSADPLSQFLACAQIDNAPLRYACFDETAATVQQQLAQQSTSTDVIPTPDQPTTTTDISAGAVDLPSSAANQITNSNTRSDRSFGLASRHPAARTESEFGLRPDPEITEIVNAISGKITDFRLSGTGLVTVLLDNGQVWQQISGDDTKLSKQQMKRQVSARVETAAFGSFLMFIEPSKQALRVKRLR